MKTNRLSDKITTALNEQMTKEAHASQYTYHMVHGQITMISGIANFLFRHAAEERNHMMKILEYILNRGAKAIVTAIPAPTTDPVSVNNCFEKYLSMN
jgi:ferritin